MHELLEWLNFDYFGCQVLETTSIIFMSIAIGKAASNILSLSSSFSPVDEAEEQFFSDNSDQTIIEWTNEMDDYYVDLMLEQVRRGNKTGSTFTDHAWDWMVASFNKTFELTCDRDLLESRFFTLKKEYKDAQHIVDQKNVGRGEINKVCETHIKVCDSNNIEVVRNIIRVLRA